MNPESQFKIYLKILDFSDLTIKIFQFGYTRKLSFIEVNQRNLKMKE